MTTALVVFASLVLAVWIVRHLLVTWTFRHDPVLGPDTFAEAPDPAPLVSVIVPARNEEDNIGTCLESLLAQDYTHFEILVIDDRSEDRTAEIVRRLAERDDRVRLLENDHVPADWTGKNYVLDAAARQARGDLLLFVDADTRHAPSGVRQAVTYALTNRLDMFSLIIPIDNVTFWEKTLQPLAGSILAMHFPLWMVNNPRSRVAFGNGQYILFRRDAYQRIAGHQSVQGELLEDIAMARKVKQAGLSLRVAYGPGIASSRMYTCFSQIVHGWARIYFAGMNRSLVRLLLMVAMMLFFSIAPYLLLLGALAGLVISGSGATLWALLAVSAATVVAMNTCTARLYGAFRAPRLYVLLHLVASGVVLVIELLAISMLYSDRGLVWKGVRYATRVRPSRPAPHPDRQ